jgi:hypothetical protein
MKVVPFNETLSAVKTSIFERNKDVDKIKESFWFQHKELSEFYSQPFSIGMLINPFEKPWGEIPDERKLNPKNSHDADIIKWKQAEELVLFDNVPNYSLLKGWNIDKFEGDLDLFLKVHNDIGLRWRHWVVEKYFKLSDVIVKDDKRKRLDFKKLNFPDSPMTNAQVFTMGDCTVVLDREELDGKLRFHLSVSHPTRDPEWREVKRARYKLIPEEITVAVVLPPKRDYKNLHKHCFHLWEI